MTIISILLTLISNAVSAPLLFSKESIRDISVIFNRIAIIALIYCVLQEIAGLFIKNDDIGLQGGLLYTTNMTQTFHMFIYTTNMTQTFHMFIYNISILMLQLTSSSGVNNPHTMAIGFYPRIRENPIH